MTKEDVDATGDAASTDTDDETGKVVEKPESTDDRDKTDIETDTDKADVDDTETDETDTDETEAPSLESDEDKPRPRWPRYVAIGLAAAILIAALSVSGVLGWKYWQEREVIVAGQQAQAAAVNYAQVLTSIDSNKVDEDFKQVLDGATGEFKDMYTQSSVQLRQLLIDNKATAQGTVVDSAVQSESKDKVVVLLMVDQTVKNTARPDSRIDRSRMKLTMEKVNGRWLTSKVELP